MCPASSGTPPATRPWMEVMVRHDPVFFKESRELVAAATSHGKTPEKLKHLIWLAVDSVVTHLYSPGAALHAEQALKHGASIGEVMGALRLAGLVLDRGLAHGLPILLDELAQRGQASSRTDTDRGSSVPAWMKIAAEFSPAFLKAYEAVLQSPTAPPGLDARSHTLIALAVESCPAVANPEGIRRAVRAALDLHIDAESMIETMQLASLIGMHGLANGLHVMGPALDSAAINAKLLPDQPVDA